MGELMNDLTAIFNSIILTETLPSSTVTIFSGSSASLPSILPLLSDIDTIVFHRFPRFVPAINITIQANKQHSTIKTFLTNFFLSTPFFRT